MKPDSGGTKAPTERASMSDAAETPPAPAAGTAAAVEATPGPPPNGLRKSSPVEAPPKDVVCALLAEVVPEDEPLALEFCRLYLDEMAEEEA
jgi:hypothetical protein